MVTLEKRLALYEDMTRRRRAYPKLTDFFFKQIAS